MKKQFKAIFSFIFALFLCITSLPVVSGTAYAADKYTIYGRSFSKSFDYYTSNTASASYSPELANMTAAMSKAVYDEADIRNAFSSLGFGINDYVYYDYNGELEPYKCCHAIGFKKSDYSNETLCLVVVRGTAGNIFSSDWIGNYSVTTTSEGHHSGFDNSADYLYSSIKKMIKDKNITGKIKYVITGHSRGGAISQLLSLKLMKDGVKASELYNYNFAVPNVAKRTSFGSYSNIFNLCNREDPVPFLPDNLDGIFSDSGESWGKFGKTYWFSKKYEGKINPLYNHDMGLYLEFFDKKLALSEFDSSSESGGVLESIEKGWAVRVSGGVNVVISDDNGAKMASVTNGEAKYENGFLGEVLIVAEGDGKVIYISGDMDFNVTVIGTKKCIASFSVEKYNYITSEVHESKSFSGISMKKNKELNCSVRTDKKLSNLKLYVVENYNGVRINTYEVNADGTESEIRHVYKSEKVLPTCDEKGYTRYTCLNCGCSYEDLFVSEEGHSFKNSVCTVCSYDRADDCNHLCHETGFLGFVWKIILFFCSWLKLDPVCDCGMAHY